MDLLLRLRPGLAALLLGAIALLHVPAARALPIAIVESQRSVAAEASAAAGTDNDADADADQTLLPGAASIDADVAVGFPDSSATAYADLQSDVGAALLSGLGHAITSSDSLGSDAFAVASAESRFRVVFTATSDSLLRLTGLLGTSGYDPGDASALVELSAIDATLDPLLLLFEVGAHESLAIDATAALHAGVAYRLVAVARAGSDTLGGETGSAFSADFSFALTEVPEPSTALTVMLGLTLLAKRRSRVPRSEPKASGETP